MLKKGLVLVISIALLLLLSSCVQIPLQNATDSLTYDISDSKVRIADVIEGEPITEQDRQDWLSDCTAEYRESIDEFSKVVDQMNAASKMAMQNMTPDDIESAEAEQQQMKNYVEALSRGTCVAEDIGNGKIRLTISNTISLADMIRKSTQNPDGSYPLELGFLNDDHQLFTEILVEEIQFKTTYDIYYQSPNYQEDSGFYVYTMENPDEPASLVEVHLQIPAEHLENQDEVEHDSGDPLEDDNGAENPVSEDIESVTPDDGGAEPDSPQEKDEYDPQVWFDPQNAPDLTIYFVIGGAAVVIVLIIVLAFKLLSGRKDRKLERIAQQVHEMNEAPEKEDKNTSKGLSGFASTQHDANAQTNSKISEEQTKKSTNFERMGVGSNSAEQSLLASQKAANIIPYIRDNLRKGYKPSEIREALLKSGWNESTVDEAFERVL